jgi:DNA-binding IclR family transcriptional regulator
MKYICLSFDQPGRDLTRFSERPVGTQVIDRTLLVLKILGADGQLGLTLAETAKRAGLNASTCHRILAALCHQGFASQNPLGRRYSLGLELFVLGAKAAEGPGMRQRFRPALTRLAATTGETVFLMMKAGLNSVCIDRHEGEYLINTLSGSIGGTVPLGVGPGSQAILAFLDPLQIEEIIRQNGPRYLAFRNSSPAKIRRNLAATVKCGYALDNGQIIDGISGVSVPISIKGVGTVGSVGFGMVSARLNDGRLADLVAILNRAVSEVAPKLNPFESA